MAYKNIYTLVCKKLVLKACSIYSSVPLFRSGNVVFCKLIINNTSI